MIAIVVVTHGRVAEELVNAVRTIHGELPGIVAVPLGWGDDAATASAAVERAIAAAGGDVLVLTDMFGGTPANLALTFLDGHIEVLTGVNLPMLLKLASCRADKMGLQTTAQFLAGYGQKNITLASELLRSRTRTKSR